MMMMMTTARQLLLRQVQRQRTLTTAANKPLILWIGEPSSLLLLPPEHPTFCCSSTADVLEHVQKRYSCSENFVGGMGETDVGVWFATETSEALNPDGIIAESMAAVKQERHGVPFGLYTPGTSTTTTIQPESLTGLGCIDVSLWAGNPVAYQKLTGQNEQAFRQVCGFIATMVEETDVEVQATVAASEYSSGARDLALGLGACQVNSVEV